MRHLPVVPLLLAACSQPAPTAASDPTPPAATTAIDAAPLAGPTPAPDATVAPPPPLAYADRFEHGEPITELERSADGALLLTRGNTALKVWDAHSGELRATIDVTSNERPMHQVAAHGETATVATTAAGTAATAASVTDSTLKKTWPLGQRTCGPIVFSRGGTVAVGCDDSTIHLIDPPALEGSRRTADGLDDANDLAFSPDETLLAAVGIGGLFIMTIDDWIPYQNVKSASQKIALGLAFTPDGDHIVIGWHTGLTVYHVATRDWVVTARFATMPEYSARFVDVSPGGDYALTAGYLMAMAPLMETATRHQAPVIGERYPDRTIFAGDGESLYVPNTEGVVERVAIPSGD